MSNDDYNEVQGYWASEEVQNSQRPYYIRIVRGLYDRLVNGQVDDMPSSAIAGGIKGYMKLGGFEASAFLDPAGKESPKTVEDRLEGAIAKGHAARAIQLFKQLSAGDIAGLSSSDILYEISDNLKRAGVDASILDPTGQKPAGAMQQVLDGVIATESIHKARDLFDRLSKGDTSLFGRDYKPNAHNYNSAWSMANDIRRLVEHTGGDYSILDPKGRESSEAMEARLQEITRNEQVTNARLMFTKLTYGQIGGHNFPNNLALRIRNELNAVGLDLSALGTHGQSVEQMERELDDAVRGGPIARSRILASNLLGGDVSGFDSPHAVAEEINKLVEQTGGDYSILDFNRRGYSKLDPNSREIPKSSEEMKRAIDEAVLSITQNPKRNPLGFQGEPDNATRMAMALEQAGDPAYTPASGDANDPQVPPGSNLKNSAKREIS